MYNTYTTLKCCVPGTKIKFTKVQDLHHNSCSFWKRMYHKINNIINIIYLHTFMDMHCTHENNIHIHPSKVDISNQSS